MTLDFLLVLLDFRGARRWPQVLDLAIFHRFTLVVDPTAPQPRQVHLTMSQLLDTPDSEQWAHTQDSSYRRRDYFAELCRDVNVVSPRRRKCNAQILCSTTQS